jgi:hypothetical protein
VTFERPIWNPPRRRGRGPPRSPPGPVRRPPSRACSPAPTTTSSSRSRPVNCWLGSPPARARPAAPPRRGPLPRFGPRRVGRLPDERGRDPDAHPRRPRRPRRHRRPRRLLARTGTSTPRTGSRSRGRSAGPSTTRSSSSWNTASCADGTPGRVRSRGRTGRSPSGSGWPARSRPPRTRTVRKPTATGATAPDGAHGRAADDLERVHLPDLARTANSRSEGPEISPARNGTRPVTLRDRAATPPAVPPPRTRRRR